MDANQVTAKVMLAAKGPRTRAVRAHVRFKTVGIMGGHVGLQVVSSSKC